jgi:asparagine synthetase B (glutamine-hydrolysing)
MEFYLTDGQLIDEHHWQAAIAQLQAAVQREPAPALDEQKRAWLTAFEQAVLTRVPKDGVVGLLFSGGVDSTFIGFVLAKHNIPFTCYTIGFKDPRTKDPEDIEEARRTATHYGWKHQWRVLSLEEMEPAVKRTAKILGDAANPVTVGVGAVVVAAAELAAGNGVHVLFGGLGSEEIFAGYHRHDKAQRSGGLDEESWRGLAAMYRRDLVRDARIGQAMGISVPTPFMDKRVITLAMRMPAEVKIVDGHKKYILRVMANEYGLEKDFAFRPKRAAQYGSRMHKAVSRLAKRAGMTEDAFISSLR